MKNPYPVSLPFDGMGLDFSVEGAKVFSAASVGGFTVPASGSKSNTFTVTLDYADVMKVVREYTSKDYLRTVIDGTLSIPLPNVPGLPKSWSFDWSLEKMIPAIKPRIAVRNFKVVPPTQEQIRKALLEAGRTIDAGTVLGALQNILQGKKPAASVIDPVRSRPAGLGLLHHRARQRREGRPLVREARLRPRRQRRPPGRRREHGRGAGGRQVADHGREHVQLAQPLAERAQALPDRRGSFTLHGTAAIKLPDEIRKEPVPLEFEEGGSFSIRP